MDDRTRDTIDYVVFLAGMAMAATGVVGEVLGWWGDLGIVLTLAGFLAGLLSVVDVNGRRLLVGFGGPNAKQDAMLHKQATMLDEHDATMRTLDRIADILDERPPSA